MVVETFAGSGEGFASDGDPLSAGLPNPDHIAWREADSALLVTGGSRGLRVIDAAGVRTIDVDVRDDHEIAAGDVYWSDDAGMYRLQLGATEPELIEESPCGRGSGWEFRLALGDDGTLVESVGGGWICLREPGGGTRWPILRGSSSVDGPDFEARSTLEGAALAIDAAGVLWLVDRYPGRILRALRPS